MPTTTGLEDLRNYIQTNWTDVALIDDGGNVVTQIDITTDGRFSFSSGSGANPLTVSGTVTGSDGDIPLPTTFSAVELRKSGGTAAQEDQSFTNATLQVDNDKLDVTLDVNVS